MTFTERRITTISTPPKPKLFVRRDDPVEKVKIVSQARTPDGEVTIEVVEPESAAGQTYHFGKYHQFSALYEPEDKPKEPSEPKRPFSFAPQDEWRRYALHLEKKLGLFKKPVIRDGRGEPEARCNVCNISCGGHAIGESCSNNDGGKIVANPKFRQ